MPKQKNTRGTGSGTPPAVKTGKTSTPRITTTTVRNLERAGSTEAAKIARDFVKR